MEEIKNPLQIESINEDYLFKIIVVGDCGVGKSNILSKYSKNIFNKSSQITMGVELITKYYKYENKIIKVNIWDTAGQEKFTSLIPTYYKNAKGAFLVYDITRKDTFNHIENWLRELTSINSDKISIILIGNKSDLYGEQRDIIVQEGEKFSQDIDAHFITCSAKNADNMDNLERFILTEARRFIDEEEKYLNSIKNDNNSDNNNKSNENKNFSINKENTNNNKDIKKGKCCK